jgi:hypothetical protein
LLYHDPNQWLLPALLLAIFLLMTACTSTLPPTSEVQPTAVSPAEDLPAEGETDAEPEAAVTSIQSSPLPTIPSAVDAADPFAYCAALGTVDEPGAPFEAGAEFPDVLAQAIVDMDLVSAEAPPEFVKNAVWRCMNGQVMVCHFGANLPCLEKADTSHTPAPALNDFCQTPPNLVVNEFACREPSAKITRFQNLEYRWLNGSEKIEPLRSISKMKRPINNYVKMVEPLLNL